MIKLLEHFKRMQDQARDYLKPDGGELYGAAQDAAHRDGAFIADMISALDSSEQREAQKDAEAWSTDLELTVDRLTLVSQRTDARNHAREMEKRNAELTTEVNDLRTRLYAAEMAHAELRGYVGRIEDERPTEMVPAPRERFLARGAHDHGQYLGTGDSVLRFSPQGPRRWFHR